MHDYLSTKYSVDFFLTKIEKVILLAAGGAGRARFGVNVCGCAAACTALLALLTKRSGFYLTNRGDSLKYFNFLRLTS